MAKAGRTLAPSRPARPRRTQRRTGVPVAAYIGFVVVALGGVVAWDQAYEAHQRALYTPAPPQVVVRNLVENIMGRGTVTGVNVDSKAGTADVTVKDVLIKPGQALDEKKKNLSAEGGLAIQFVQSRFRFKTLTVHLVQSDGKLLATVTASGQGAPTTEYSPDLK